MKIGITRDFSHTSLASPAPQIKDPKWIKGPRVRIDTLRKGDSFMAIDGDTYTYERVDGALSGVHHVTDDRGQRTAFAGCAEVVKL